jgi:diguanylate cyclase (GGDEF)-like protein
MQRWLGILGKLPSWAAISVVVFLSLVTGTADWASGYEISFAFFYFIPVFLAAWTLRLPWIVMIALLNAGLSLAAQVLSGQTYSHPWIFAWNSGMRLASFLLVGFLVTQIRTLLLQEQTLARTDVLTQLLNRRAFEEVVEKELDRMERSGIPVVLVTFDLDDFKTMNDTHGHGTGDRVLKEVGRVLGETHRQHDVSARLGGDEFALLLPMTGIGQTYDLVVRVKTSLEEAMKTKKWPVGFSFGAVEAKTGDQFATLLDRADRLMYRVKHDGKNGILIQN